jgi:hypothetical protein
MVASISRSFVNQYRSAVYLSNAATTLLAHGDYQVACQSLRDALSIVETIVRPTTQTESSTNEGNEYETIQQSVEHENADISSKIHRAAQHLALLHSKETTSMVPMEILCYDGSLDSRSRLVQQQNKICSLSHVALPIWISDIIVDHIDDDNDLLINVTEIVPAILLSNFALVNLCHYKCTNNQSALDATIRLFHMSMHVLCVRDKIINLSCEDNSHDMIFTEGRIFVTMVILSNIKCMSNSCLVQLEGTNCRSLSPLPATTIALLHVSCLMIYDLEKLHQVVHEWIARKRFMSDPAFSGATNAGAA